MTSKDRTTIGRWILFSILCLVLYLGSRLVSILAMPIFTDEAIYIRWAQIGANDPAWRLISLTDGKQPLFSWIIMAIMRFVDEPLLAGRLASVGAGMISMMAFPLLSYALFSSVIPGAIAAVIYLFSPTTLLYDRLAIYDSLVAALFVLNTALSILLVRKNRLDVALLLGMGLGLAMLNKTSGFMSLYVLPMTLILFPWGEKDRLKRLGIWIGLVCIATVISQAMYAILRLSPFLYIVSQKDALFVYPFKEWIHHPFTYLYGNLRGMSDWFAYYVTLPLMVATLYGILRRDEKWRELTLAFGYFLAPFVGLALFGKVLYPRYILFMIMPIYLMAAWGIWQWWRTMRGAWMKAAIGLVFLPMLISSVWMLVDIKSAPLHSSDSGQYVNDWPAGWGVKEIATMMSIESKKGPVTVYTEGTFGLLPFALEIYLNKNKNVQIKGIWPFPNEIPEEIRKKASEQPVYLVMYQSQVDPNWPVGKILSVPQGRNDAIRMRLYQVKAF